MIKKIKISLIFTLSFFLQQAVVSQEFNFSKIEYKNQNKKLKGSIFLTDSTFSITTNNNTDYYKIRKVYTIPGSKQYKGSAVGEDVFIRITLSEPKKVGKNNPNTLFFEMKDTFRNDFFEILYFLDNK